MVRPVAPASSAPRVWLVQFAAPWYGFVGRAFGIAFLNLLTIGLYKPYGITRTRQALYTALYIGKDALSYTGTARGLARVTFYPSLAFLALMLVPGAVQFMVSWQVAVGIGLFQLLLLVYYSRYLDYRSRQYEWDNISWRGLSFTAGGNAWVFANATFGFQLLSLVTLGLAAPWRRVWALRYQYGNLFFGRHAVSCTLALAPLLPVYFAGLVFALAGWAGLLWWSWHEAVVPVQKLLAGGAADPAMASSLDASMFGGGMMGAPDSGAMAEVGTFVHALTIAFIVLPVGLVWQKLCLAPFELALQRALCASLTLAGSSLRFEGGVSGLGLLNAGSLLLNFVFCNLTRPFTTFARLRYLARHMVVRNPQALETALKPPQSPL